jgi:hypothetical protein
VDQTSNEAQAEALWLRAAENLAVRYSEQPLARAIIATAAFFFPPLFPVDAAAGAWGAAMGAQRLRATMAEVEAGMARVHSRLDSQVNPEELVDYAIQALRGATETRDTEKRRVLAAALVGAATLDRPADLDFAAVIAGLSNLTPADLQYARELADAVADNPYKIIDFVGTPATAGDSTFHLLRLEAQGLVHGVAPGAVYGSGPGLQYRLTPTFWRVLDLLRAGGMEVPKPADAAPS